MPGDIERDDFIEKYIFQIFAAWKILVCKGMPGQRIVVANIFGVVILHRQIFARLQINMINSIYSIRLTDSYFLGRMQNIGKEAV
jgi:hypothetical protein